MIRDVNANIPEDRDGKKKIECCGRIRLLWVAELAYNAPFIGGWGRACGGQAVKLLSERELRLIGEKGCSNGRQKIQTGVI
jgi:hypothetical protein